MTDLIRISLDRELVNLAAAEAAKQGIKRHEWIETAIRKGLDGGDRLAGSSRPEEEAARATQPSTPSQILATPIEENTEKRCNWGPRNEHRFAVITSTYGDHSRCDYCRMPEPLYADGDPIVRQIANGMEL